MKAKEKKDRRTRRRNGFLPVAIGMTGGVVIASAAFWFFAREAENVVDGSADKLDETLMELVHQTDHRLTRSYLRVMTQLGSHVAIGTAAGIAALSLRHRGKTDEAWTIVLSTAGAMALNTTLKAIFQRQRPKEMARHIRLPRSHSFPSGHSLLSAATYPIVIHQLVQSRSTSTIIAAQAVSAIMVISVGFSRVYFGVHFPSDVFGGFAAGIGWLGLTSLTHALVEGKTAGLLSPAE